MQAGDHVRLARLERAQVRLRQRVGFLVFGDYVVIPPVTHEDSTGSLDVSVELLDGNCICIGRASHVATRDVFSVFALARGEEQCPALYALPVAQPRTAQASVFVVAAAGFCTRQLVGGNVQRSPVPSGLVFDRTGNWLGVLRTGRLFALSRVLPAEAFELSRHWTARFSVCWA